MTDPIWFRGYWLFGRTCSPCSEFMYASKKQLPATQIATDALYVNPLVYVIFYTNN